MPKSDRDPAVLAAEREARLAARMAKHFLKSGAVEDALGYLQQVLADPRCPTRTKVQAAKSLAANASKITSKRTQLDLSARTVTVSMADLLAMAQQAPELPNAGEVVVPAIRAGAPAPNDAHRPDSRSPQPGVPEPDVGRSERPDSTEGFPLGSAPETPAHITLNDKRKEDPTESLGDAAPSSDTPELDDLLEELDR